MFAASKSGRRAVAATDPFFRYVPLLLETTSTNGQQNNTFLDSSTNNFTITRNGTPTQGSVTPYWPDGYWSTYVTSSTDYVNVASSAGFAFPGAFTVEGWFFWTSTPPTGLMNGGNGNNSFGMYTNGAYIGLNIFGAGNIVTTSSFPSLNTWHHIAMTRDGSNNCIIWVDGVNSASAVSAHSFLQNAWLIYNSSGVGGNSYISNYRIVKGVAVYTGAFTPPTLPLQKTQSAGTNISAITGTATSLLTLQSNRLIDNSTSALAVTATGSPRTQAFQPFPPLASYTTAAYGGGGYFNGSTDGLTAPSTTAFAFGSGVDFTVECWVYLTAYSSGGVLGGGLFGTNNGAVAGWMINSGQDINTFRIISNASGTWADNITVSAGNGLPLNQWTHVAFVRSGAVLTLYKNGTSVGSLSGASAYNFTSPNNIGYIGYCLEGPRYVPGYISNLRVVKGTAVYTANFTPPTAPVTAITNTSLLTNFTNAGIYDAAVQNNQLTAGSAQASTTVSKWSPTSMKFNGTTDYLTAIDGPQLQLGTGDFTIDGWVYVSAIGVLYGIISKGTATTGWSVNITTLNKLQFSYTASNLTGATSLAASTWYYFAVVRSGSATGNLKVYLNGTADATSGGAVTDAFTQTNTLYVGADRIGTSLLSGYLQDVRITKYARTITTPTAAFPTR
jgi:hypothetical protein